MIFATGAFCAIVYALSIVLFQYCNSFIMCSQLLLPQVAGYSKQIFGKYDFSSPIPCFFLLIPHSKRPQFLVSLLSSQIPMLDNGWRHECPGERWAMEKLSVTHSRGIPCVLRTPAAQGSMMSPLAVNIEVIVSSSAADGGNPEASPSHQQPRRMIYWCHCTSPGSHSRGSAGCQDSSCTHRLVSLWAESTSGNLTNFSTFQITEMQLHGISKMISPCGFHSGLQGDLGQQCISGADAKWGVRGLLASYCASHRTAALSGLFYSGSM